MKTIICDIEIYSNCLLVGLEQLDTGKRLIMEQSDRSDIDMEHLRRILMSHTFVGFNSMGFDAPLLWFFLEGATVAQVKGGADRIINGGVRYWEVEDVLGVSIPYDFKKNHIDLIEPQPNPFASLKILNARLHGKTLRDLPYAPELPLSHEQIDTLSAYLHNDLDATKTLYEAMGEAMELRRTVGLSISQDVRSKSDTQMGLAIIKNRAETLTGRKIAKPEIRSGRSFRYKVPAYIKYEDPALCSILRKIAEHEFFIGADGKVELPDWLANTPITLGSSTYSMGIGGLHSTESNRCAKSSDSHVLTDFDVSSYYPAIILTLGLYPEAIGPDFLKVYEGIRADRLAAKKAKNKAVDKALKISLNGCFGSLGSRFSFAYAPHLLIAVTLTGQLALLMLIERAERMGIPAISGNTDGVVFHCPRDLWAGLTGIRPNPSPLSDLIEGWERDTGFDLEGTEYKALYSQSVNSYVALKSDGGHKRKGPIANPWNEDPNDFDPRGQMMKNPQMTICSDAALAKIKHGTPLRETIEGCSDIRQFVTVIKATKGATWRGEYLGKTIRYYWSTDGEEILEAKPHPTTGNFKKISKTEGAAECMTLPDELPSDIDFEKYIAEAEQILKDLGYYGEVRPPEKRIRLTKANRIVVLRTWMVAA